MVFRHEIEQGRLPFYTSSILSMPDTGGPVNLGVHNYTTFANLLALPLIPRLGLVATFNLIFLANIALSGYAMFLFARHLVRRAPESWLAGAVFAASPVLVAKGVGHYRLVAAAPLPLFALLMRSCASTGQLRYALAAGATAAWATFCDAYYGVFCVMLAGGALVAHLVEIRRSADAAAMHVPMRRAFDALLVVIACFVIGMAFRGGGPVVLLGMRFSMRTLYTPVLVLTVLLALRVIVAMRPILLFRREQWSTALLRSVLAGGIMTALLLSPVLYAFGERYFTDSAEMPPTYWRSSPPGVDLLALLMPNPNHPPWGDAMRQAIEAWAGRSDAFPEYVGALSWVAMTVVFVAWWRGEWRLSGVRWMLTAFWVLVSLGPFVHIAGLNTHIPTPWTFLRYAPIIGLVRSPSRFSVVVTLVLTTLFALALAHLASRYPARRRAMLATIAVLLGIELWPAPRTLYSAEVPRIYDRVASDPRADVRVLGLPVGVRDGASSLGNFSATSQFYQTHHGKAILGGYLSRVSPGRKQMLRRLPVLNALMTLSERQPLTPEDEARARAGAEAFLARSRVGYVVIDHEQASPELVRFATELLGLRVVEQSGPRVLYVPRPADARAHTDAP